VDENVPTSVGQFLRAQGFATEQVRDVLAPGTPDPILAVLAENRGWVVITMDRHFDTLVKRVPEGGKARFRRVGRITLHCNPARAAARIELAMPHINLEWKLLRGATDQRMMLVIRDSNFAIER
jgi:hypothetical protein